MKYQLSQYYKNAKSNRDIFQELMAFKVKEILLVANLYDSYSVAREGEFFDRIQGEYRQLNLYAAPRITHVDTAEEAMKKLDKKEHDMVILMAGLDKRMPLELAKRIKKVHPNLSILLLVNNNSDLNYFGDEGTKSDAIDRVFVWNGDSKVFLAMTKYVEDKKNVANDTLIGDVRIILLVEDSIRYYTRYLPILYSILMMQTQNVVHENSADELHKILKMRGRPKILLAANYEEAEAIVNTYGNNLLCVISDVNFEKKGEKCHDAGYQLLKKVTTELPIPCLMQSRNLKNKKRADELGIDFLWKDSETLTHEIFTFLKDRCGFGDFVFKLKNGRKITQVSTIEAFAEQLQTIPQESLVYHGKRQGISSWFMAHSEINLAKKLRLHRMTQNANPEDLRKYITDAIYNNFLEKLRGRVIEFDRNLLNSNRFIVRLGQGSLGGKGRGMAFLSHFLENVQFDSIIPDLQIAIPCTAIIGVEEFDLFIENNHLYNTIYDHKTTQDLREVFIKCELSNTLKSKLCSYLEKNNKPLAIRSSGLFEDSMLQPFAGVYATYFLPNIDSDFAIRLKQLETAIKLVYASIFSETAANYFEATKYKIEEEKMGVIIQEMVGEQHEDYFYPHLSGVAQSFNYYPYAYMKPEDGFSVVAVGMGEAVVGGERSHRFCPHYPKLEILSLADQVKDSQTHFYALNLKSEVDLLNTTNHAIISKIPIKEAENHGTLHHSAQVFDTYNQRLGSDFSLRAPRIINFANILKYDHIPLAKGLSILLDFFAQAMGAPVEIEYAMNIPKQGKATLQILQIKPLIKQDDDIDINIEKVEKEQTLFLLKGGMGNGHYTHIQDVVYMKLDHFDKSKTRQMAEEIAIINKKMQEENREYVLIGVGRWGTRDPFIGVPVFWSQIANARIIIEMGIKDLPLEASLGSHFFHNVTSMNVGYFSIPYNNNEQNINFNRLAQEQCIHESLFFKHVRFDQTLDIKMDGKNRIALAEINTSSNQKIIERKEVT